MDDESDDERSFEPISSLTLSGLGKGMMNRARTQGVGIARQIAQNYQDMARTGRDLVSPVFPREPIEGHSILDSPTPEMKESPFAAHSSDLGVRVGAQLFDPQYYVGGGSVGLGVKALKQAATSRALRAAAEREALAKQTAERVAQDPYAFLLRAKRAE